MTVLWVLLHAAGYLALATLILTRTVRFRQRVSAKTHARDMALRMAHIAKLELQLGIGLDYGKDWLLSRPIACQAHMRDLVKEGNGAVERMCWGCDKNYRPHDEYSVRSGHKPSWYEQTPEDRELTDRLCRSCYLGATRKDFGVDDFVATA